MEPRRERGRRRDLGRWGERAIERERSGVGGGIKWESSIGRRGIAAERNE